MRTSLAIIGAVVLAAGLCNLPGSSRAANEQREEQIYAVVYRVSDLPVWQFDPTADEPARFNPQILIAHIRTYVGSEKWNDGAIRPFAEKGSLVVFQTQAGHARVAELIAALRNGTLEE